MTIIRASAETDPAGVQIAEIENKLAKNRSYFNVTILALIILLAPLLILAWLWLARSDALSEQSRPWILLALTALSL